MSVLIQSQNILYLVLAFCVLWITVFLVWFLCYLISVVRQFHKMTSVLKRQVDGVEEIVNSLKSKIESSSGYLSLLVEGVKKIIKLTKKNNQSKKAKSKVKNTK